MAKIVQGFIFLATSQVLTIISGFITNIFLIRYLERELYGQYSYVVTGILAIGLSAIANGFPQTLSKNISENKVDVKSFATKLLCYQLIEALLLFILYVAISPLIASILNEKQLLVLIITASFIIPAHGIVSLIVGLFNGLRQFHIQSLIVSLLAISKTFFTIIFCLFLSVQGAIIGFLVSNFTIGVFSLIFARRYFGKIHDLKLSKEHFVYFFRINIFNFSLSLILALDLIFLRFFLPANQNDLIGLYNAGAVISKTAFFLIISFSGVMFPTIANLLSEDKRNEAKIEIGKMIKLSSIFLVPLILILSSLSSVIIQILFGIDYIQSNIISSILVFGYSILGFFVIFANILNGIGNVLTTNIISILTIISDAIFLFLFIREKKIVGAAIATTIASFIGFMLILIIIIKKVGVRINFISILRINFTGILIFGGLNILIKHFGFNIYLWIPILISEFIIYVLILVLFKDLRIKELFYNMQDIMKTIQRK